MTTDESTPVPEFTLQPGFEVLHFIEVRFNEFGPVTTLVCTAAEGAPCRRRPADPDVEEWSTDYAGEWIDDDCWAVGWVEDLGWDTVTVESFGRLVARVAVTTAYDDGLCLEIVDESNSANAAPSPVSGGHESFQNYEAFYDALEDHLFNDTPSGILVIEDAKGWPYFVYGAEDGDIYAHGPSSEDLTVEPIGIEGLEYPVTVLNLGKGHHA